jgi:hypothetical protein
MSFRVHGVISHNTGTSLQSDCAGTVIYLMIKSPFIGQHVTLLVESIEAGKEMNCFVYCHYLIKM